MLTVRGRLLKVQSRNLPAARNFSSGLRAIFMQGTPDPGAAPDVKGGPLAPFGPGWQTFGVSRHHRAETRCAGIRPQEKRPVVYDPSMRKRLRRSPAAAVQGSGCARDAATRRSSCPGGARRPFRPSGIMGSSGSGGDGGAISGARPATGGIGLGGSLTGPSITVPRGRRNGDGLMGATTFLPTSVAPSRGRTCAGPSGEDVGPGGSLAGAEIEEAAGFGGSGGPRRPARDGPGAPEAVFTGAAAASGAVTPAAARSASCTSGAKASGRFGGQGGESPRRLAAAGALRWAVQVSRSSFAHRSRSAAGSSPAPSEKSAAAAPACPLGAAAI